jgi:hypothetical protein
MLGLFITAAGLASLIVSEDAPTVTGPQAPPAPPVTEEKVPAAPSPPADGNPAGRATPEAVTP